MILVEAQTFEMGCTDGMPYFCSVSSSWELPVHTVTLTNDYFIGETEVTQEQYELIMGTNPSAMVSCGSDCPVDNINWYMAAAYANAVSDAEGLEQCYSCSGSGSDVSCSTAWFDPYECEGYRLPMEAEWEAAARCGEDTQFAGSTVIEEVGWVMPESGSAPHPVATKEPNACGLYDMTGNALEWVEDGFNGYPDEAVIDPYPPVMIERAYRGGSWSNPSGSAHVSWRNGSFPGEGYSYNGLRLVRKRP